MVQALSNDGLISELSLSSWRVFQECVHIFLVGIKVIPASTRMTSWHVAVISVVELWSMPLVLRLASF